jgi:predicted metal-dependent hydrolase
MEDLFTRGVEEFNRHFFFEAHDVWEEVWRETSGAHRIFYQGLIQTAVGFYHLSNGNYRGACSQFRKALGKLDQYLPSYHGINTASLVEGIRVCLLKADELRQNGGIPLDTSLIPRIELC